MTECIDELERLMTETPIYKMVNEITKWYENNKNNPLLSTYEGQNLRKHLNDMMENHAMIYLDMAKIHLRIYNAYAKKHDMTTYDIDFNEGS